MSRIVSFGEVLLRLSPETGVRLPEADSFSAYYGGSEANAAVTCAMFGDDSVFITKVPSHKIVSMGLAQVPERRRDFAEQTVEENLDLGAFTRKDKDGIKKDMEEVYELFPRLKERRTQLAGTLSGGEQQMLAMGRALMAKPRIMLLDEPSMGLSPLLVNEIFRIIKDINQRGTTVLLVEQNAKMALAIASRAYVLETGKITLEGTGEELARSEQVRKAYLGG